MTNMPSRHSFARIFFRALPIALLASTGACTSVGPSKHDVSQAPAASALRGIQIVDLNEPIAQQLRAAASRGFAESILPARPVGTTVGPGDVLEITIWEAPPAALFGSSVMTSSIETSRSTALPGFLVDATGRISVPFAGLVPVAGRTLPQIENEIVARLRGKAHLPQVMVRLTRNATANVTVVGEVEKSTLLPLTPKGEHLLDALAAAGGTRQPVNKMTIQISRDGAVYSMPLEAVIRDPRQNIVLKTGDVVTAIYQPYSFTVLGAAGKNEEVVFEATGLTLAQAMGRIGGLQEGRADAKGVFVFRWVDPALVGNRGPGVGVGPDGRIPMIYRVDMKDTATYFAMQHFDMRDKDVVFISNSPVAEVQRVIGVIASAVFPIVSLENSINRN